MCGILFVQTERRGHFAARQVERALQRQSFRGPDAQALLELAPESTWMGHNRLAIVDPLPRSNQPFVLEDGRWHIVFNGEIYNHVDLRRKHRLDERMTLRTNSDTETLLAGYALMGERFLDELEGMYAFVIVDKRSGEWLAARDPMGIKPLYLAQAGWGTAIASEPSALALLTGASVEEASLHEWRLIRRPTPGHSFFQGITELMPGDRLHSNGRTTRGWQWEPASQPFDQADFDALLTQVVRDHEMSDVDNVALLSGGIDSALILALSRIARTYSAGLKDSNEFEAADETARALDRQCVPVQIDEGGLAQRWRDLARLRGEPLSVPNEALIHAACEAMAPTEKVVLTGEGADELMFGYDRIFAWATQCTARGEALDLVKFLRLYGYSDELDPGLRLHAWITELAQGRTVLEFVEDFFWRLHLTGLLRRMDFASMAAHKEARVPFADRRLARMCYRQQADLKISGNESKRPLREMLRRRGLTGPLERAKVGFVARTAGQARASRQQEYRVFQDLNLESLSWT
jgi:asparagine synthase (glutamine-hydrolysing)